MADEDDVIEVVEEVEVDVLVDDDGNPVGAVVDDVIVASGRQSPTDWWALRSEASVRQLPLMAAEGSVSQSL